MKSEESPELQCLTLKDRRHFPCSYSGNMKKATIYLTVFFASFLQLSQQGHAEMRADAALQNAAELVSIGLSKLPFPPSTFKDCGEVVRPGPLLVAGTESSGGGVSADDPNGRRRLLDLIEKDKLDYFLPSAEMPWPYDHGIPEGLKNLVIRYEYLRNIKYNGNGSEDSDIGGPEFILSVMMALNPKGVMKDARFFEKGQPGEIYQIRPVAPIKWAFTDEPLESLNDEGIIRIENPNTKRQLAIQKNGMVVVNRKEFESIDDESKAGLFIHESVLRAVLLLNPQEIATHGTENVRTYTRRFLNYIMRPKRTPGFTVLEAYRELGITDHSAWWPSK